jgi:hypothetical protein
MKVITVKSKPAFTPITIQISIESSEEFYDFKQTLRDLYSKSSITSRKTASIIAEAIEFEI